MALIDELKAMGAATVNMMTQPIKDAVRNFSDQSVAYEKEYARWFKIRANFAKLKIAFPHETTFQEMVKNINRERETRILLLKALHKAGANPKDYGLQIMGLTAAQVAAAYPGLKYDPKWLTLGGPVIAAPIAAAVVVALIGLAYILSEHLKSVKAVNFGKLVYDSAKKAGKSDADALALSNAAMAGADKAGSGALEKLIEFAPWAGLGFIGGKMMKWW